MAQGISETAVEDILAEAIAQAKQSEEYKSAYDNACEEAGI